MADRRACTGGEASAPNLAEAYRLCEEITRAHYENFPVVSRLLPKESRRSLAAVYAFARQADDFADEDYGPTDPTPEARLAALDDWERRLREACAAADVEIGSSTAVHASREGGQGIDRNSAQTLPLRSERAEEGSGLLQPTRRAVPPRADKEGLLRGLSESEPIESFSAGAGRLTTGHADAVFVALADTMGRHDLDGSPFFDLLSAFRQDVLVSSYRTRAELLDYCRRSANPVGRIVLAIHGERGEHASRWSDALCTGLQLTNFWQDVAIDAAKDRIYLPQDDCRRLGVSVEELRSHAASPRLRALILEEASWARELFVEALPLLRAAPSSLRFHLKIVWHGGRRILEKILDSGGDVLTDRPKLVRSDWARILLRAALPAGSRPKENGTLDPARR